MDPNYPWVKARQRWATHMLVRLGKHTFESTAKENEYLQLTGTPRYFDPDHMPSLSLHHIFFIDECHKRTDIGRTGDTLYTFPRDENGIYDAEGGIADVDTKLHVTYAKEGQFSFGVAAVMLHDGTV
jgi:hypothetical protein